MRMIIKGVPSRHEFIGYLKKHLPNAEWCMDEKKDVFDTFLRAWKMAGNDPCVHMEEDIILTKNFVPKIEAAIAQHPNSVIQFFSMRKADIEVGSRWDRNFMMNQCTYLPYGYSRMLVEYFDEWAPDNLARSINGTDELIRDFLKSRGEQYWIHVPSLVEHRVAKSSIDPRRSSKRQSKTFEDPLE